jgi:hypothetical protein
MKQIIISFLLLAAICILSCTSLNNSQASINDGHASNNTTAYTTEQILKIAKGLSPECRLKKPVKWESG